MTANLPISETLRPSDAAELAAMVRAAYAERSAVYPVGGGTSLEYGLEARKPGVALSTVALERVVDYPARDLTITVEAGLSLARLAETLQSERQWLPIDAPEPDRATVGGLVATGWNGPRQYGWGSLRDYVIGVSAVDGRGVPFRGGGRVVKNVAGYDLCKLLTGSCGTLAVISQVTFKVRPLPAKSVLLAATVASAAAAERQLAALNHSRVTPAAIELVAGPHWSDDPALGPAGADDWKLVIGLEGSEAEVDWMANQLDSAVRAVGELADAPRCIAGEGCRALWERLREFSHADSAPLLVQAVLRSSRVCDFVDLIRQCDPSASIQAHAASGVVIARFQRFDSAAVSRTLVGKLQPAASAAGGQMTVLAANGLGELTRQAVWGGVQDASRWMDRVRQQFDPQGILNPGRFFFSYC